MFLNISVINDFAYNQILTISGDGAGNQEVNGGGNAIYQMSDDTDYILVTPEDYASLDSGGNINLRFYSNEPAISDDGSYPEPPTDTDQPNDVIE